MPTQPSRVIVILGVVCGALSAADGSAAQDIEIALAGPDFPPYYEIREGRFTGDLANILKLLWAQAGYRTRGEVVPAARLMAGIVSGASQSTLLVRNNTLDGAPSVLRSPKPISRLVLNLYGRVELPRLESRDDLKGRSISVVLGYGYGGLRQWMADPANAISLTEVPAPEQAVRLLAAGRTPFALLYDVNYRDAVRKIGSEPNGIIANHFQYVPAYVYVHRDAAGNGQAALDKIMAAYERLVEDGVLDKPDTRPEDMIKGPKGS